MSFSSIHLSGALGLKAIEAGYRVVFTTAANMIAVLTRALTLPGTQVEDVLAMLDEVAVGELDLDLVFRR